ncbi:MAG: hypothetical protein ACM3TR_06325 [Caulobacteraceae bacterium]
MSSGDILIFALMAVFFVGGALLIHLSHKTEKQNEKLNDESKKK